MKIQEIKYFRKDGINTKPNGFYVSNGFIYAQIANNKASFYQSALTESFLSEKVVKEQNDFTEYKGGMIVFSSANVNTVVDPLNDKPDIVKTLQTTWYSLINQIEKDRKIYKIIRDLDDRYKRQTAEIIGAFGSGNFFKGKYISDDGDIYDEASATVEIGGIPRELLLIFAAELCKGFKQETVLVKDFNEDKVFLVESEEKPENAKQDSEKLVS